MNKMTSLTTIWMLTSAFLAAAPLPQSGTKLCVSLSTETVVKTSEVCLEQIATLTGPAELVAKARLVKLGVFSSKGQVLYADRNTVLSRLASLGIMAWQVELVGAEITSILQNEVRVDSKQLIDTARTYLDKQLAGQKINSIEVAGVPAAVILTEPNATMALTAQMSRYQTPGTKKVTVTVSLDGVPVAQREVAFAARFQVRRVVAIRDISVGTVIREDDVKIEQVESTSPEPAGWQEPFGLTAQRQISSGTVIPFSWFGSASAPVMIRRNQQVMVQINTGTMHLSAPGQSLDEGRVGELIRVRRGQKPEERIIYCTVRPDGTVCPQM